MEKEPFFSFLNLNWDQSADQAAQFESALSSLVSSPTAGNTAADSGVIRELIGRLGSICNSGEVSPTSHYRSAANSCYSTPLNSPPKLNLMTAAAAAGNPGGFPSADPAFAERAAKFSCFGGRLSRAPSSQSLKEPETSGNGRKRKAAPKGKGKETALPPPKAEEEEDSSTKRSKAVETEAKEEPPKQDYIHVRARRGQATDSHSLAERVRREKISERMKFLQDLVPGCNKVTGKAVMLDEIINYVQSLQRQVEFLSMKLATVNPRLEFNVDTLIQKDPRGHMPPHPVFPMDSAGAGFTYVNQPQIPSFQSLMANGIESHSSVSRSLQLPHMNEFVDASSQVGAFWEDDLQSVVQMGFVQNQDSFSSQTYQAGSLPTSSHMKIEL